MMVQEELARRFTTYMDAVVAFAVVNLIAFTSAIADQEVRCVFAHIQTAAVVVNVAMGLLCVAAIRGCDRARESLLRSSKVEQTELTESYERRLLMIRYVLVTAGALGAVGAILGASFDSACATM